MTFHHLTLQCPSSPRYLPQVSRISCRRSLAMVGTTMSRSKYASRVSEVASVTSCSWTEPSDSTTPAEPSGRARLQSLTMPKGNGGWLLADALWSLLPQYLCQPMISQTAQRPVLSCAQPQLVRVDMQRIVKTWTSALLIFFQHWRKIGVYQPNRFQKVSLALYVYYCLVTYRFAIGKPGIVLCKDL